VQCVNNRDIGLRIKKEERRIKKGMRESKVVSINKVQAEAERAHNLWEGHEERQETESTRAGKRGGRKREAIIFHRGGDYGATKYTERHVLHRRIACR
jgi:hypothetical protein